MKTEITLLTSPQIFYSRFPIAGRILTSNLVNDKRFKVHLTEHIQLKCYAKGFDKWKKFFDFAGIYESLGSEELVYMDVEKDVEEAATLFSDLQGVKVVNSCSGLTVLADSLRRQLLLQSYRQLVKMRLKDQQNQSILLRSREQYVDISL